MPFFTPNVPAWFVDNCVKTSSQLKEQHIRLVVRETKPHAKKGSDELLLSGTPSPPSPTVCPQDGEVHDQDAGAHEQDTDSMAATQQEKGSPFAPWSTPHEQLSPSETVEPSDPYELDAALYQRLRDLVLPEDSEDDVTKSQHLATYPHIPKFARDLLHTIMTRSQVLRIIIDGIIFVLAVFLPIKFLQQCLIYMEMPRPWFVDAAASLRRYQRFQFFKQAFSNMFKLLNIQPTRKRRFIHDGVVLRFERHGGGGQQFLTSVVGYFARDIGANLIILNKDILRGLLDHNMLSETTSDLLRWFAKTIGSGSPRFNDIYQMRLRKLLNSALKAGRRSGKSQGLLADSTCSADLLVVLADDMFKTLSDLYPHALLALRHALSAEEWRGSLLFVVTDQQNLEELRTELNSRPKPPNSPHLDPDLNILLHFVINPAVRGIEVAPFKSKAQTVLLGNDDEHDILKRGERLNIHNLKRELATVVGGNIPPLIQPYTDWKLRDSSRTSQILRKGILSKDQIQSIARNIAPSITMERIDHFISAIMDRFDRQDEIIRQWKTIEDDVLAASKRPEEEGDTSDEEETATSLSDAKIGYSQKVRDAINKIEGNDDEFEWEAKLLSSLVDPVKIKDGWDDIALEPEVRTNILRTVSLNIEKPEAYGILKNAQIGGALLYGPPGTGKTHLARVLAKECNSTMIHVSSATIESRYVGDTEKFIKALFNLGRMVSPSIIFIDEAESLFRMRTTSDWSYDIRRVNQLLGESDNLLRAEKSRPFLILATNYPTQLDHAVLRRIPGRIYLGPPSLKAREDMFRIYLRKEQIDSSLLPDLASMTDNYSGSDLRTLCIHAATISHFEHESQGEGASRGKRVIKMAHFEEALRANTPTITRAAMREIERFASQFDRQSLDQIRGYLSTAEHYTNGPSKSNPDTEVNPAGNATELVQAISGDNQSIDIPSPPTVDSTEDDITSKVELGPCTLNSPYRPLDRQRPEIRVLELMEPSTTSSMIHGRLRTVTLQPGLSFTALSYMWGDPASNEEIILNGEPFRITKSLANTLRWVKHHWQQYFPGRDGSEFRLWADAVCINQEDDVEKSFQVPLMGGIFGTAELVISSIASQDRAISFALKTYGNLWNALTNGSTTKMSLNELTDQEWMKKVPFLIQASYHDEVVDPELTLLEKETGSHENSFFTPHGRNTTEAEFLQCCKEQNVNPTYMAIRAMSRLPYWCRVWVIQEIVLGKSVLLICDDSSLDLKVLDECTSVLQLARRATNWVRAKDHRCWQHPKGWCARCWDNAATRHRTIIESRRRLTAKFMENFNRPNIVAEMHSNMNLKATDPRDLVYGLLGLGKFDIEVDYSKTLGQVYGDYVRYCLTLSTSLSCGKEDLSEEMSKQRFHFLKYGGIHAWLHDPSTPSWVPNFQRHPEDIELPREGINLSSFTNDIPAMIEYPDLHISGISIQQIIRNARIILQIPHVPKMPYVVNKAFLSHLRDLKLRGSNYVTGMPILQAVCRALIQSDEPHLSYIQVPILVTMRALMNTGYEDETHRIFDPNFQQPFNNPNEEIEWYVRNLGLLHHEHYFEEAAKLDLNEASNWWKQIEEYLWKYCFFETEDGYLGLGPASLDPGDTICMFRHCPIPVILRSKGDYYTYVGPCWIVGLTTSKEIERLQSLGRIEQRQFVMR
ncbi:hypothetical protein PG995_006822 [Apiospora arundinis]